MEVYNTERQLLYVACTRARDFLLITAAGPASEFQDDMRAGHVATSHIVVWSAGLEWAPVDLFAPLVFIMPCYGSS